MWLCELILHPQDGILAESTKSQWVTVQCAEAHAVPKLVQYFWEVKSNVEKLDPVPLGLFKRRPSYLCV